MNSADKAVVLVVDDETSILDSVRILLKTEGFTAHVAQGGRAGLERLLGCPVFLELFVRVQRNWTRDRRTLRDFGYE